MHYSIDLRYLAQIILLNSYRMPLLCLILLSIFSVILPAQYAFCESKTAWIDIEKVLIKSNAAHLGREHLKAVRERLEEGHSQLGKALVKTPAQQRNKEMQEAAHALNQQLELEKAAINRVITNLMMEEIRSFRIANKIDVVLPKQVILDADAGLDITNQIIKAMNTKNPVFGQLPTIQIKKPAQANTKKK